MVAVFELGGLGVSEMTGVLGQTPDGPYYLICPWL